MIDVLPIGDDINDLAKKFGTEKDIEIVAKWLDQIKKKVGNWKFIDAPIRITGEGGHIVPVRIDNEVFPEPLRRQAFLEFRGFGGFFSETSNYKNLETDFYVAVPSLARVSSDFERINEFARVVALLRWSKEESAFFYGAPIPPKGSPTPGSVITGDGILVPGPSFEEVSPEDDLKARLRVRLAEIAAGGSEPLRKLNDELFSKPALPDWAESYSVDLTVMQLVKSAPMSTQLRYAELTKAIESAGTELEAPEGSVKEKDTQDRMKNIKDKRKNLTRDAEQIISLIRTDSNSSVGQLLIRHAQAINEYEEAL